jgi:poly(3-hydroxybutyrate) depolymerase
MRTSLFVASVLLALSACGDDSTAGDGGDDGGIDAATDSSVTVDSSTPMDSGTTGDATSTDGAADAMMDAGPVGSAGCVDGAGLDEGEHTFMLEGMMRRYILRLPNGYTRERPWPLVLALHGNGGSTSYWDGTSGSRNIRGVLQDDAILIVAEAIDGQWRDYSMDSSTWPARIESELLYFEEVLTQAREDLCIREDAIFSMGFSGGGSFSGVLGCRRTDIRAIAVGGSVIYFDEADCVGYPAAWITIGTEELTSGREAYRDWFRDRAGCSDTSMPTEPDPPCVAYDGCNPDTPVHYCQHPDGHIWPDFGSDAMWQFFSQFLD